MSSEFAIFFTIAARLNATSPHSAKNQITRRPTNAARSTQLLNFSNSTAVAWVWNPVCPSLQALNRDQTLGLRSVVPSTSSSFYYQSHPIMPRCEAVLLLLIQSTVFPGFRQIREPHPATARPPATKSEYQPAPLAATRHLWRTCASRRKTTDQHGRQGRREPRCFPVLARQIDENKQSFLHPAKRRTGPQ